MLVAVVKQIQKVIRGFRARGQRRCHVNSLKEYQGQAITDALNEVYTEESSELDPVLAKMQFASVEREAW